MKLDSVVSNNNKLNHEFSTYLSCVQNQKATAVLFPTRKKSKLTEKQDRSNETKEIQETKNPPSPTSSLLHPTTKPLAGENPQNPFNPDKEMLGESHLLAFPLPSQGIELLLPPKQQAPSNNYGESVKIKFQRKMR